MDKHKDKDESQPGKEARKQIKRIRKSGRGPITRHSLGQCGCCDGDRS